MVIFLETNVPQVEDTGNNPEEVLGAWDSYAEARRTGRGDSSHLPDQRDQQRHRKGNTASPELQPQACLPQSGSLFTSGRALAEAPFKSPA